MLSVSLVAPLDRDLTVKVAIDPSKVDEYNRRHQTSYFPIPDGAAQLVNDRALIPAGKSFSEALQVRVVSTEDFEEGRTYLSPSQSWMPTVLTFSPHSVQPISR